MKKVLIAGCVVIAIIALSAFVLVNRWATTPYGKLDYKVAIVLKLLEATSDARPFHEILPDELRAWYNERPRGKSVEVAGVEDRSIPGPRGEIPIRIYTPVGAGNPPVIVYYHGGGWVVGSIDTHDAVARELANRAASIVVSVDYRLAPENPFPTAVEEAYAALAWVSQNAESLGGDATKVAVAGDSAGGNLAAVVSLMARDKSGPTIRFQALIYPVTNLSSLDTESYNNFAEGFFLTKEGMEWFRSQYLPGKEDWVNPHASPLLAKDHSNLPPAIVITAQFDPLRDEGEAYVEKLKKAGVQVKLSRYDGMIHGFVSFGDLLGEATEALDEIAAEFKRTL